MTTVYQHIRCFLGYTYIQTSSGICSGKTVRACVFPGKDMQMFPQLQSKIFFHMVEAEKDLNEHFFDRHIEKEESSGEGHCFFIF